MALRLDTRLTFSRSLTPSLPLFLNSERLRPQPQSILLHLLRVQQQRLRVGVHRVGMVVGEVGLAWRREHDGRGGDGWHGEQGWRSTCNDGVVNEQQENREEQESRGSGSKR